MTLPTVKEVLLLTGFACLIFMPRICDRSRSYDKDTEKYSIEQLKDSVKFLRYQLRIEDSLHITSRREIRRLFLKDLEKKKYDTQEQKIIDSLKTEIMLLNGEISFYNQ